jgi:hypothetical protein
VLSLLALLPEVSLGITAMKAFLFDEKKRGFSSELERTLIRLVRSSQEISMPWAKRGILMRSVRERLLQDADRSPNGRPDGPIGELEKQALAPGRESRTIQILREALDEVAIDRRVEKENAQLRARVKELEQRIASRAAPQQSRKAPRK